MQSIKMIRSTNNETPAMYDRVDKITVAYLHPFLLNDLMRFQNPLIQTFLSSLELEKD